MMIKIFWASALLLGLSLPVFCQGIQDEHMRRTRYGSVEVKQSAGDNTKFQITFKGRKIHEYEGEGVEIKNAFQVGDKDLLVLQENSGGIACPSQYVIIEVSGPNSYVVSDEFGSCSDLARSTVTNGALTLEMPSYYSPEGEVPESEKRRLDNTIEVYTWAVGKLTHTTKPRRAAGTSSQSQPVMRSQTFTSFWAEFKAAVAKGDKEAVATMTKFPFPWGEEMLTRDKFLKKYSEIFNQRTQRCFAKEKPVRDGETYSVFCGERIYSFELVAGKYKFTEIGAND